MSDQLLSFAAASTQVLLAGSQRCHLYRPLALETSVSPTSGVPLIVGVGPTRALEMEARVTAMAPRASSATAAVVRRRCQRCPSTTCPTAFMELPSPSVPRVCEIH